MVDKKLIRPGTSRLEERKIELSGEVLKVPLQRFCKIVSDVIDGGLRPRRGDQNYLDVLLVCLVEQLLQAVQLSRRT